MPTFWKSEIVWNKTKKKKAASQEDSAWTAFSKLIRLRDCLRTTGEPHVGRCVTCNNLITNKGNDAGHYVSRTSSSLKYDLRNVHLQCTSCNRFGQGKWAEYHEFIESFYGKGTTESLLSIKNDVTIVRDWKERTDLIRRATKSLEKAYESGLLGRSQSEVKKTLAKLCKENTIQSFLFGDDRH